MIIALLSLGTVVLYFGFRFAADKKAAQQAFMTILYTDTAILIIVF